MSWTGPIFAGLACCGMMYLLERFTTWAVRPKPSDKATITLQPSTWDPEEDF